MKRAHALLVIGLKTACFEWQCAPYKVLDHVEGNQSTKLERFSIECRETKTKVITPANHKEHRQYSELIKTRSNYM